MPITINGTGTITGISAGGLPDAIITQPELAANVVGNGPAFSAYQSTSTGTIASTTFTKVTFDTELWDTNNNFASSRFTPTVAGYYEINSVYQVAPAVTGLITIYKNGSDYKRGIWINTAGGALQLSVSGLVYCNGSTDYIEIYMYQTTGTVTQQSGAAVSWFDGCLVRAA
jgi:hypothetical protein